MADNIPGARQEVPGSPALSSRRAPRLPETPEPLRSHSYYTPHLQLRHQHGPGAMQARAYRADRTFERHRRIAIVHFLQIAQYHYFTISRRQRYHRLANRIDGFPPG